MNINLTQYRNRAAKLGVRAFSAPYLPDRMITAALLWTALHAVLVLASQNLQYWYDNKLAESSLPFIQDMLRAHPLAFLGATLAYMAVVWLILQIFNRPLALIAWCTLAFLHFSQIFALLDKMTGIFSGENSAVMALLQTLLIGLVVGVLLATLLLRPVKERAPKAAVEPAESRKRPWFLNWKVELGAVVVVAALGALAYFTLTPKGGWKPVQLDASPGPRCCSAIAYDPRRERAVLFGGATEWLGTDTDALNDTWEWDSASAAWVKIETMESPPVRSQTAMAYDEARGVMVMFGGRSKDYYPNDTWEYDGKNWYNLGQSAAQNGEVPLGRVNHQLIFDPTRQKVILFGGYAGKDANGENLFPNDAWQWDGQTWTKILASEEPPILTAMSMAWEMPQGRLVAMNYDHPAVWNGNNWETGSWINPPPGRDNSAMAPLPGGGLVMFGGYMRDGSTDETWLINDTTWKQYRSTMHPSPRGFPIMFTDTARGRVYLYGGRDEGVKFLSDMWEFSAP